MYMEKIWEKAATWNCVKSGLKELLWHSYYKEFPKTCFKIIFLDCILVTGLLIYFFIVVNSFHQALKKREQENRTVKPTTSIWCGSSTSSWKRLLLHEIMKLIISINILWNGVKHLDVEVYFENSHLKTVLSILQQFLLKLHINT